MCVKAVDKHTATRKCVFECYKNQEICYKTVNRCFFVFDSILDQYKTQEMCDKAVYLNRFLILHCPDIYAT